VTRAPLHAHAHALIHERAAESDAPRAPRIGALPFFILGEDMSTFSSRRRRFRPMLDNLDLRIAPSGTGVIEYSPMDPSLDPWEPMLIDDDSSPMDPTLDPIELPNGGDEDLEPLIGELGNVLLTDASSNTVTRSVDQTSGDRGVA
jgi:hypothetical protein